MGRADWTPLQGTAGLEGGVRAQMSGTQEENGQFPQRGQVREMGATASCFLEEVAFSE